MTIRQDALALAYRFDPANRQAYLDAVNASTDNAVLERVVSLVNSGKLLAAFEALGISNEWISTSRVRRTKLEIEAERLGMRFEPQLRNAFLTSIQGIKDRVILKRVIAAIDRGDPIAAFEALGFSQAAMRPITAMVERLFEEGGVLATGTFPLQATGAVQLFDVRNSRAEQWLREYSSNLVTRITGPDQLEVVRNTITEGMERGQNPRQTALDLVGRVDSATGERVGGTIGLTSQQERYVANARRELENLDPAYFNRVQRGQPGKYDKIVERAIEQGKPLDKATIDRLITLYESNQLRLRGTTIARTESIEALNRSQFEAFQQAIEQGTIDRDNVKKEWDAVMDLRTRHDHALLNGRQVAIDAPFIAIDGSKLLYPGDKSLGARGRQTINCRCRVKYVVDWYADLREDDDDPVDTMIVP